MNPLLARIWRRTGRFAVLLGGLTLVMSCTTAPGTEQAPAATDDSTASPSTPPAKPLAGRTVVIDPGHQLGNSRHLSRVNRLVDAGGFRKPCNTTGTATNFGYPEATFTFQIARALRKQLTGRGADVVVLTRRRNSLHLWGPCVDVRGKAGNRHTLGLKHAADAKISIHGDGASAAAHGFHVISPAKQTIRRPSARLGKATSRALRAGGFRPAGYVGPNALVRRDDLATLNLSAIPVVMVELGNMRNAQDAKVMRSAHGQRRYARALAYGLESFLARP